MTGPVVGVIGGGQLARMLAEAATPLGIHVRVLAAPGDEGAAEIVPDVVTGRPDDRDALRSFARDLDVVTFDHENVDHAVLSELEHEGVAVRPGVGTLRFADKAHQRRTLSASGIAVPDFVVVDPIADAAVALDAATAFATEHPGPEGRVVVKASRGGYDGRGVWMLAPSELASFLSGYDGAPLVIEPELELDAEFAVVVARRPSGQSAVWPVLETIQVDGMCNEVRWPAGLSADLAEEADALGRAVAEAAGAVGVLAIELFLTAGRLVVNELAPRVHNSGHLTIEASRTSQFEQHLRAVLDWPLGPTDMVGAAAVMANVVGESDVDPRRRQARALDAVPEASIHLYGKSVRPARKIGHVTVLGDDLDVVRSRATTAAALLSADVTGSSDEP